MGTGYFWRQVQFPHSLLSPSTATFFVGTWRRRHYCHCHYPEVNISSYPATEVAGLFFFRCAEILNSGGFVQKYSDQGVSCKNIGQ